MGFCVQAVIINGSICCGVAPLNRWAFTLFTTGSTAFIVSPQNSMVMKKIAVLLVDDHTVVRQGLRALLSSEEDIEVIGEAENGRQAVMLARKTPPDVV